MINGRVERLQTRIVQGSAPALERGDDVAVEEPLEIRVATRDNGEAVSRTVAVTLRTPGEDLELAVGYLHAEGVIRDARDVVSLRVFSTTAGSSVARVELRPGTSVAWQKLERTGAISSSCGACGKTSAESVRALMMSRCDASRPIIPAQLLHSLQALVRARQPVFARTGGLHAAALFDASGRLLLLREDVGRHNAVDKVVGAGVLAHALPWRDHVLFLSGRVGFELVQKAAAAGIGVIAAVGAPSSMAVEGARACGITLAGFVRDERFNVYTHPDRVTVGLTS